MERNPVSSTSIHSVGYDPQEKILEIEFKSGEIYQYEGVPLDVYTALLEADSHGKYFLSQIRDQYTFQKITG